MATIFGNGDLKRITLQCKC